MYKLIVFLIGCVLVSLSCKAQTDEDQIHEVIDRLFKGMQLGDSAMVGSTFDKSVTLATSFRNKDNTPILRKEYSIKEFLTAVGTPHHESWNEEIWNMKIDIDGDLASVWCNFAFYAGKRFSHCGVNVFQLHKGSDGWKIFHLADTRRSTGCEIPEFISGKYN